MTYRVRRKFTSSTFRVEGQLCKVFLEPVFEYSPGYWIWNVGFAVGKSRRQLNDWYWRRKNKRRRSLISRIPGRSGIKAIRRGFEEVLRLRWNIEPGDGLIIDSTSAHPDKQFHAFSRWHRYHPEWVIDYHKKEFIWYRPPYNEDPIRQTFDIIPAIPPDPLANTVEQRYFDCFLVRLKDRRTALSMDEMQSLLGQVLSS
jgi:hypothetical protein